MFASRPAVHPVEAPPTTEATPERVRMKDYQGTPGTVGSLVLRLLQFVFAITAACVMATTSDFVSVNAFWVPWPALCPKVTPALPRLCPRAVCNATILQSFWSLSLAFVDVYVLLVKRSLRTPRVIGLFAFGDGITVTLTFAAACSSAGITVLIGNDLNICGENHCSSFEAATAMAFISWSIASSSFLLNFWSLASR